ncbi:hypothetical protein EV426DRAFT_625874 [Tirmania nivea]|nr:hypothetical protein EV426DRAFT_625874 [Tirmania nivea]
MLQNPGLRDDDILYPTFIVGDVFPENPTEQHIHIIIKVPKQEKEFIYEHLFKKRKTAGAELHSYFRTFPKAPPSMAGKPTFFLSEIQKDSPKIHCNRPFELSNVPLALLHPIFGQFRDWSKTVKPSPDDNHAVLALTEIMLKHYSSELDRQHALHGFFLNHLRVQLHAGNPTGTNSQTDGHGFANINSSPPFIHVLTEVKNELTGNSTDPYFQVTLLFKDYLCTLPEYVFSDTICPVMVVIFFGCYLQIAGMAVTTNGIQIEPLSPAFAFFADPYDEDHRSTVTKCLAALRESLSILQDYYKSLSTKFTYDNSENASEDITDDVMLDLPIFSSGIPPEGYPYMTSCNLLADSNSKVTVKFEYLFRPYPTRLLFLAKSDQGELLIKFTRRYSKDIHLLLSGKGFAPELLGIEAIPGGWLMVIMKSVLDSHQSASFLEPKEREAYREDIENIVACLHGNGFVHGDLRPTNLLVPKSANGNGKVLLVDFDEAGQDGTASYPPNLNTIDITRPKSAIDGALITKEHDNFMLRQLFKDEDTREPASQWRTHPAHKSRRGKFISRRRARQEHR